MRAEDDGLIEYGFLEMTGAYGFQFGQTEYIPDDSPSEFMHPLVNGYGLGLTGGWELTDNLHLVGNYEYTKADSRTGSIPMALDEIEGNVSYQTATAGLRVTQRVGYGSFYGELAIGVVFPFEVERRFTYSPALSMLPEPIEGTGARIDNYNLGLGGHGLAGYRLPITDRTYIGTSLKLKSFQSNNDGETTELINFVSDFSQPQAQTMTIDYDTSGGARPTTFSVQDIRMQLTVGASF